MNKLGWVAALVVVFASAHAHAEQKLPDVGDTLAGVGTFVPSYLGLMLAGALTSEHGHTEWGFNACPSVTVIPVAGPIMALFVADSSSRAALAVDSVAQLAGAGFLLSGLVWPKANLTRTLMPVPVLSQDMTGVMLMGKF